MRLDNDTRVQRHLDFWAGGPQTRPLLGFMLGDLFISRQYAANLPLLRAGTSVDAQDIVVDDYLGDYERMYTDLERIPQDCFYVAEPCPGLPWMEAMLGARVFGEENAFITKPVFGGIGELEDLTLDKNGPWYKKYMQFVAKLHALSAGRFPVGQSILRGVTDTVGALIGQTQLVYDMIDEPDAVRRVFARVADIQREIVRDTFAVAGRFLGGTSFGYYRLWTPGSGIWYQDDLAALLSPRHYDEFLRASSARIIAGYDRSFVHLHPQGFIHLDYMCTLDGLSCIEINKDTGYETAQLLPACQKVLASGKRLQYGNGAFTKEDVDLVYEGLPHRGVALFIAAQSADEALELSEYIDAKHW